MNIMTAALFIILFTSCEKVVYRNFYVAVMPDDNSVKCHSCGHVQKQKFIWMNDTCTNLYFYKP